MIGRIGAALVALATLASVQVAVAEPSSAVTPARGTDAYAVTLPARLIKAQLLKFPTASLRVGSYNVRCESCYTGQASEQRWAVRRGPLVASVLNENLDVIGVQEASQGRIHDKATGSRNLSQFEDLRNRLGSPWKVTDTSRYNCVDAMSPNHCHYRDRGASGGNRIFYNSDRVALVRSGAKKLPSPRSEGDNYMAWAELRLRSTGKRFMVSDLHTVSPDRYQSYKRRQAVAAAKELTLRNVDDLPMVAVGDWNSSRFEKPGNGPYDAYLQAGFVDPLGGAYRTSHSAPGATVENRIRTWVSSSNDFERHAPAHRSWVNGSYIDYIMTTPMRVSEWETVARLDSSGRFIGVIPSDHNLIRATVWLP